DGNPPAAGAEADPHDVRGRDAHLARDLHGRPAASHRRRAESDLPGTFRGPLGRRHAGDRRRRLQRGDVDRLFGPPPHRSASRDTEAHASEQEHAPLRGTDLRSRGLPQAVDRGVEHSVAGGRRARRVHLPGEQPVPVASHRRSGPAAVRKETVIGHQTIDVGGLLDEAHWSTYQKLLVAATATTIILDGLDNQLLGAAVPAMMREWSLPRPAFVPVQTAGMVGMMIGGAIGGVVGDRLGRRVALLGSVIAFGALTVLVSMSGGIAMLTLLRFLAGFGLGGAMPNAAALSSEYVPIRERPFA